uniref:uncharacterized protein LOC128928666 isoform X1 n=1 Tax=Callithrix jacchus TaxID=9483 RepID=UPI00159D91FB|nr:uncharacterized protein LOC128928666 isoform X1 [Callithrix jacchus]
MRVWFRGQRTRKAAVWLFHRARIPHRPACRTSSQSAVWQFLPVPRKGLLFLWLDSCSQTSRGSAGEHGGRPDTCRPVRYGCYLSPGGSHSCYFLPVPLHTARAASLMLTQPSSITSAMNFIEASSASSPGPGAGHTEQNPTWSSCPCCAPWATAPADCAVTRSLGPCPSRQSSSGLTINPAVPSLRVFPHPWAGGCAPGAPWPRRWGSPSTVGHVWGGSAGG